MEGDRDFKTPATRAESELEEVVSYRLARFFEPGAKESAPQISTSQPEGQGSHPGMLVYPTKLSIWKKTPLKSKP